MEDGLSPLPELALPLARRFDLCGPLPEPGVTILEASAGTGKTFTIAALVTRMVAEDLVPLERILVVTFTRMATGQLRDRVRARLVSAEAALGRYLDAGEPPPAGDEVLALLTRDRHTVLERRERLADALANFDSATITTTHGFCHMVLAALGTWGEVAPGAALLEDPRDLVQEVVDDLFARYVMARGNLPFRRRDALEIVTEAVANPGAVLGPDAVSGDNTAGGLRRRLVKGARLEVARRLLDANLLTYDDLLVRLARALSDPARGTSARNRLRDRFGAVLVDEFQDTDLVQWDVVSRAFAGGGTRLVLIGDPKQAVYAFRGADVYAYLRAARGAAPEHRFTLDENWRSDGDLLAAFDALLAPLHLGHGEIRYRKASAPASHAGSRLQGAPVGAPLRARLLDRTDSRLARIGSGLVQKDSALKWVARDLAGDIVALLSSGARLLPESPDDPPRPVGPHDIGVLVRTNRQAAIVQGELGAVGVPVVVAGAQSVLSTAAARDWLRLLEALEQPASRPLAVAAALTALVGMTAQQLADADETTWEPLHARLHTWAALVRRSGVATLFGHVSASQCLPQRLLGELEGERRLTDLGHIAELLHAEARSSQLGLAALRAWLGRRIDEASPEGGDAERRSRRLDSDAAAVQVLTVHRAKGLEFPIVYCPYLWDGAARDHHGGPVIFHEPSEQDQRKLDVGGESGDPVYEGHFAASQAERRGEDIRHLYVALSRAKHQVVVWWAPVRDCQHSALGRLLLSKSVEGDVASGGRAREPKDPEVEAAFRRVAGRAPGLVSVEAAPVRPGLGLSVATDPASGTGDRGEEARNLVAAVFERTLDLGWQRSSYTSITAEAYAARHSRAGDGIVGVPGLAAAADPVAPGEVVSSEPEDPGTQDEPLGPLPAPDPGSAGPRSVVRPGHTYVGGRAEDDSRLLPSLLARVPAGADVGTFVHGVLERVDFAEADLRAALRRAVEADSGALPRPAG